MLKDLERGPSAGALAIVYDWTQYNFDMVASGFDRKPRIDMWAVMTGKGNLSVAWQPRGPMGQRDWVETFELGWRLPFRPDNEFIFVRGISDLRLPRLVSDRKDALVHRVDDTLRIIAASVVEDLKQRLSYAFDVRMQSDINMLRGSVAGSSTYDVIEWDIETTDERDLRLELKDLNEFPGKFDCPLEDFAAAVHRSRQKKKTGLAPTGTDGRVFRDLKSAGFDKVTIRAVGRFRHVLRKHKPEVLPVWDRLPPAPKCDPDALLSWTDE
jgi:hypothetical protein